MLITIAWRNVWRNKIRSLVVIMAIALGLWGGVSLSSFSWGMAEARSKEMIEKELSHIQIHAPEFREDPQVKYFLPEGRKILTYIKSRPNVHAAAVRLKVNGMISSTKGALGTQINGVDPEDERVLTKLDTKVVEGEYFSEGRRNQVIIGQKMAERLNLKLRKKVVITFQNTEGDITAGAFRIIGIYKTINSKYDEANIFVKNTDLERILGTNEQVHELALMMDTQDRADSLKVELADIYPNHKVEDWKDLAPDLKFMSESMDSFMQVFMAIFMLGMAFGIINTMLMAVLERTRELGMLMSIGMNKVRVFLMIMMETIFLTLIGGPVGLLLAYGFVAFFGRYGIDMSMYAEALESLGYTTKVYTYIDPSFYVEIGMMVVITAILSSIYPAIKALSLKPVEAVRAI